MKIPSAQINTDSLLENIPAGVVVHEMDTSIVYANREALKLLNLTWDQAVGKDALDPSWRFLDASGSPLPIEKYPVNQVIENNAPLSGAIVGILTDEVPYPTWVLVNAYIDSDNGSRVVVAFSNITEQYQIPFKEIVDKAKDVVVVTEADILDKPDGPKIVYVNDAFCQLSGFSKDEVIGKTPRILQGEGTDQNSLKRIRERLNNKQPIQETILNYSKNGTPYWIDISIYPLHMHGGQDVSHFVAIERDVTLTKEIEQYHIKSAQTDPLTGLMNRRGFEDYIQVHQNKLKMGLAIIAIDLDHFKKINDEYGHSAGDEVLEMVAKVIRETSRENDACCRFGGEEFII